MHLIIYTGSSSTEKMPALLEGIIPENQQLEVVAQQNVLPTSLPVAEHLLLPTPSSSFTEVPPPQASKSAVHAASTTLTRSSKEIIQSEDTRLLQQTYPSGKQNLRLAT